MDSKKDNSIEERTRPDATDIADELLLQMLFEHHEKETTNEKENKAKGKNKKAE